MSRARFQGEIIRDHRGREVVCFTTKSGVQAIVATCISESELAKMAQNLRRKIARRMAHLAGSEGKFRSDRPMASTVQPSPTAQHQARPLSQELAASRNYVE